MTNATKAAGNIREAIILAIESAFNDPILDIKTARLSSIRAYVLRAVRALPIPDPAADPRDEMLAKARNALERASEFVENEMEYRAYGDTTGVYYLECQQVLDVIREALRGETG